MNRPQIDVEAERLPQAEQTSFGALFQRQRIPLRAANRTQQNRFGRASSGERFGGKRSAEAVNRDAAKSELAELKLVFE